MCLCVCVGVCVGWVGRGSRGVYVCGSVIQVTVCLFKFFSEKRLFVLTENDIRVNRGLPLIPPLV